MHLEGGDIQKAAEVAYDSMMHGALALLRLRIADFPVDADRIVSEFRSHFFDTNLFFDPYAQGKFAQYYFQAHERTGVAIHHSALMGTKADMDDIAKAVAKVVENAARLT